MQLKQQTLDEGSCSDKYENEIMSIKKSVQNFEPIKSMVLERLETCHSPSSEYDGNGEHEQYHSYKDYSNDKTVGHDSYHSQADKIVDIDKIKSILYT